ncbi:MAG TPA: ABC transporter permease [Candidatus Cloacimonadota bacterium]|nr:ABC transporter permease [Candidatus Cloacimonadota bacterium]
MAISLTESLFVGISDILMRKVRSIVTVIGIILGVMSIMVVLAIVNGMNKSTMDWMKQRGGLNKIEIGRNWSYDFRQGGDASFSLAEVRALKELTPEAKAFNPQVLLYGNEVVYKGKGFWGDVWGVMPDMLLAEDWGVAKGRFFREVDVNENNNVIVLGHRTANDLFGNRDPIGQSITLAGQQLTVIGVMTRKYWQNQGGGTAFGDNALEYMNTRSYVPISTMMNKLSPGSKIISLDVLAPSPEAALKMQSKLKSIILNMKSGKELFRVSSAQQEMQTMKQNSLIFTAIFIQIAVISLLVGGIVIMNIMLASIKERTREIGVRLAIGARRLDIFLQFMVQTVLITTLGGVLGIALGYAILGLVGDYLKINVLATVQMIWIALAVSVGVGLIFGITPAVRAGRLDPVTALREE